MSAYNPPTQDQSIFNPTNYGTSIKTLADSAYDEITATTGTFSNLLIGSDNVATTLNGKQDTITSETEIDSFSITSNINFINPLNTLQYNFLSYSVINDITTKQEQAPLVYFAETPVSRNWTTGSNDTYIEYNFDAPRPTFDNNTQKLVCEFDTNLVDTTFSSSNNSDFSLLMVVRSSIEEDGVSPYTTQRNSRTGNYYHNSSITKISEGIKVIFDYTGSSSFTSITIRLTTTPSNTNAIVSNSDAPATLTLHIR